MIQHAQAEGRGLLTPLQMAIAECAFGLVGRSRAFVVELQKRGVRAMPGMLVHELARLGRIESMQSPLAVIAI